MDYQQAIAYIESLALLEQKLPSLPSLDRIETFFSHHNSPQNSFTAFHIGGTNGKGSTVAMLDSVLRQGKWKVGRFTGPHLLSYNERFHINGQPILDQELALLVATLKTHSESFSVLYPQLGELSWFEFLTAVAFFYFAENNVDIGVIEVGLGGRFDATNVLKKLFTTTITNIALDHERILGSDLESIAMEKAGIIKSGIPVITAASEPALSVISRQAAKMGAPLTVCDPDFKTKKRKQVEIIDQLEKIKNALLYRGSYQYQNALIALNTIEQSDLLGTDTASGINGKITFAEALAGLQKFYWPGRFQIIQSEQIILDAAHNSAGIMALRKSLDYLFSAQQFHFVFACYNDKDGPDMLKNLLKPGDNLYLVNISGKRLFFDVFTLEGVACEIGVKASIHSSVADAFSAARMHRISEQFIIACGSFAIVKAAAQSLGWNKVEDGMH